MKARCHGDYHLRQVWLSNNDFLITNYGGGPELRMAGAPLETYPATRRSGHAVFVLGGCRSRAGACDGGIS